MRLAIGIASLLASFALHGGGNVISQDPTPAGESVGLNSPQQQSLTLSDNQTADNRVAITPQKWDIKPYSIEYSATYNGMPINTLRSLSKDKNGYRVTTQASNMLGTITEEETFHITAKSRVAPHRYLYKRSIFGNKRTEESVFDGNNKIISNVYKDRTAQLPFAHDMLGPLSYQVQLQIDLANGKQQFSYPVVSRGKIKEYRYRVVKTETLETPLGRLDTLVLERQRDDQDRKTFLWLAGKLQYLPVKIVQQEDGENYELLIKSYTLTDSKTGGK